MASVPAPRDLHAIVASGSAGRHAVARNEVYRRIVAPLLAQMHAEPDLSLEGCRNFRDLGGLRTATGASVRARRLFRSDALTSATVRDRQRLHAAGLATVIDLRSEQERSVAGMFMADGVVVHHLPLGDLVGREDTWERWRDPGYVAHRYFDVCVSARDSITEAFAVLTDPAAYPVVVHCSLGKDRTGVLVALVLRAIGVPVGTIVDEYTLSRLGARRLLADLRAELDDDEWRALTPCFPALTSADPATMLRFLGRIDDEFGSITGYLRDLDIVSAIPFLGTALLD
jgi:protein-tyrosine phosphatase